MKKALQDLHVQISVIGVQIPTEGDDGNLFLAIATGQEVKFHYRHFLGTAQEKKTLAIVSGETYRVM